MDIKKLTHSLQARVAEVGDDDVLDVVVEINCAPPNADGGDRQARIAAVRTSFEREATPLAGMIEEAGGEVLGRAWINQTLRARIPAHAMARITDIENVARIDVPHALTRG